VSSGRWLRYLLLVVTTGATLLLLLGALHTVSATVLVLLAGGAAATFVVLESRRPRTGLIPVSVAIAVVLVAAVVTPPRISKDLWSYTMYGRIVTVHRANPYVDVPAKFPSDPFLKRVGPRWRKTASVYGPLFVGTAAAASLLAGDSALLSRLFFQIMAALALLAILVVVWRTTASVTAVAFLGLNPVLALVVVNGGHNDAIVGLGVLLAVVLTERKRPSAVGVVLGLAALIKLTALLALIGIVVWAWRQGRKRFAFTAALTTGVVVSAGYLIVLLDASRVLGNADRTVTSASPWNPLLDRLLHHDAWRNVVHPLAPNGTLTAVFYASSVLILLLAVGLSSRAARSGTPGPSIGVAVAAYPLAAEYTLPWYAIWGLPVFATRRLTPVAWVVWTQSIVMLAALKLPGAVTGNLLHTTMRVLLTQLAPPLLLVAFIAAVLWTYRPQSRSPTSSPCDSSPTKPRIAVTRR